LYVCLCFTWFSGLFLSGSCVYHVASAASVSGGVRMQLREPASGQSTNHSVSYHIMSYHMWNLHCVLKFATPTDKLV